MTNFPATVLGILAVIAVLLLDLGSTTAELTTLVVGLGLIIFGTMISFQ
ncbi:MAG: membrane protein [Candidatus Syntrophoarchaeum butanivorans]|uniref:Membrane protein n=1 Tax=Candidatus Syntropharchaeum butanivorans TaxID=1839936 RepID=A0A1F2P5M9_9EURY|nr:MAG: membrane protein [Candidatus Syntrophoarchaeum butanivorans]